MSLPDPVQQAVDAGWSVVPADQGKRPNLPWKAWTETKQTPEEVANLGHGSVWGVVVGEIAGAVVLDFDKELGMQTMAALNLEPHVRTATGAHVYVRHPGHPFKSSAKRFPQYPGLDIKGERSLAYMCGRSKSGAYNPVSWPPEPVDLDPALAAVLFPREERETAAADRAAFEGPGLGEESALRYLHRAAEDIENAPAGSSNAELNKAAFAIGGLVAGGQLDADHAAERLSRAAENRGASDVDGVMRAALASGAEQPWKLGDDGDEEWERVGIRATRLVGNSTANVRSLTDLGNAERLIDQHGRDILWVADAASWYVFVSGRWGRDTGSSRVRHLAQKTAQGIHMEAAREGLNKSEQRDISKWALSSQSAMRLRAMEEQARYRSEIQAAKTSFDQNKLLVNFGNGTLDLGSGEFRAHRREDRLTRMLPLNYGPDAGCPLWLTVLERALPDVGMRRYLQRALGTGLIGQVPDRAFFLVYGPPGTGKSIVVETVANVLGEYALKAKPEALLQGRHASGPTPELAELEGRRFVYVSETEQHARLAVARMKDMTGSGRINGRRNREDGGEFPFIATLLMDTNHPPAMGGDRGAWERVHLLVFETVVAETDRRDRHELLAALTNEAPGIVNWLVAGALDYMAGGLQPPAAAVTYRNRMLDEEDHVSQFVADLCEQGPEHRVEPGQVFAAYDEWCRVNGFDGYTSQQTFWKDAALRSFETAKSNGRRYRVGIRLRSPEQVSRFRPQAA